MNSLIDYRVFMNIVGVVVGMFFLASGCKSAASTVTVVEKKVLDISEKAMDYFLKGSLYEDQEKYAEAILEYLAAARHAPKHADIFYALGKAYEKLEKNEDAIEFLERCVQLDSLNQKYVNDLFLLYFQIEDYDRSMLLLQKLDRLSPGSRDVTLKKAEVYKKKGQFGKALSVYSAFLDSQGYDEKMLLESLDIHIAREEYHLAGKVLDRLITEDSKNASLYRMKGDIMQKASNQKEAEKAYRKSALLMGWSLKASLPLINHYAKHGSLKAFEAELKKLLDEDRDTLVSKDILEFVYLFIRDAREDSISNDVMRIFSREVLENKMLSIPEDVLEDCYVMIGDELFIRKLYKPLEILYQRGFTKLPNSLRILERLVRVLVTQEKYEAGTMILEKHLTRFPKSRIGLHILLGLVYYEAKRDEKSISILQTALKFPNINSQDKVRIYSILGSSYDRHDEVEKGEEVYMKALAIDPENASILNNLAYLLAQRGLKLQESLNMAKKAVEKDPENASFLDTKGWVLYKLKKYEEAKKWIEKSLYYRESSATVQDHMGDVLFKLGDKQGAKVSWLRAIKYGGDETIREKIEQLSL